MAVLVFLTTVLYGQAPSLVLSSGTAGLGQTLPLNLNLTSPAGNSPVGLQWTLTYNPADVKINVTPGPALAGSGKTLTCNSTIDSWSCFAVDDPLVVLVGGSSGVINDGVVAVVTATLSGFTSAAAVPIKISALGVSGDALALSVSGAGGSISVTGWLPPAALLGMVAAYAFDEGSGSTAADASGNGNGGQLRGAARITAGEYSNALSFDGNTSYVDLGSPPYLQTTGSMTWSAWVYLAGRTPNDGIIAARSDGNNGWQLKISNDSGKQTLAIAVSPSETSLTQRYGKTELALNVWYHVAGVYNADTQALDIYLNGAVDNGPLSGVVPTSQVPANVNTTIGKRSGGQYFNGSIDNLRIYTRPLSQAEIWNDANLPLALESNSPPIVSSFQCNATAIASGSASTCTVTLSQVAGPGGAAVAIASPNGNILTNLPSSVQVDPGLTAKSFNITAAVITSDQSTRLTATLSGASLSVTLSLMAPRTVSSLVCTPAYLGSNMSSTCTVALNQPAPAGDIFVAVSSNNPQLSIPPSVPVSAGSVSAVFNPFTGTIGSDQTATVTATLNSATQSSTFQMVALSVASLRCTLTGLEPGMTTVCTVTLTQPAPAGGAVVLLSSDNPSLTIPASVAVGAGLNSANFSATEATITTFETAIITATLNGASQIAVLALSPPLSVAQIDCSRDNLGSGTASNCILTLTKTPPVSGISIVLSSNNPLLTVPASVTFGDFPFSSFNATAETIPVDQTATITASVNGLSKTKILNLVARSVTSLTCPAYLASHVTGTCRVVLSLPAPAGGAAVSVSSSSALLTVPDTVTISQGATAATFDITASTILNDQSATVMATLNGVPAAADVNLAGPLTPSLTCAPGVLGPAAITACTVLLNQPSPVGGVSVALSSDNTLVTVPPSINVAQGGLSATFTATASAVPSQQTATLTSSLNGVSRTLSLVLAAPGTVSGEVARYAFDEGTGAFAFDSTPNGNTGRVQGASWNTTGRFGKALSFNGTSNFVDLGAPSSLQITGSTTWSTWVYATGNPVDDSTIASAGWQFKTSADTGSRTFGITVNGGFSVAQRYSKTVVALNTWYHVAGVYNATSQTLDIYVNGLLDNGFLSGTVPPAQAIPGVNTMIGKTVSGFFFKGLIDNFRIYNRALAASEIQTDMYTAVAASSVDPTLPAVSSLLCSPTAITSASNTTCTIALTQAAPTGGTAVVLSSNNPLLTIPASVNVAGSSTTATFSVTNSGVSNDQNAILTATLNTVSQAVTLRLLGPLALFSLTCNPGILGPATTTTCRVLLNQTAPVDGVSVALTTDNPFLTVAPSITVAQGALSATFNTTAGLLTTGQASTLSAFLNGVSKSASLALVVPGPVSGEVASYALDEGAGSIAGDSSSHGNTGQVQGATWTPSGRYGNALSFDGTAGFVDLGTPAGLQNTGSMTWSAWVFASGSLPDDGVILSRSDGSSGWQLKTSNDTGPRTFGIAVSTAAASLTQRYSNATVALNTWYHVAGIYNATAQTLDIYVNGVLADGVLTGSVGNSQVLANANTIIGKRTGGFFFKGVIDNLRIYNRALSAAEVQSDMLTPVSAPESSLKCNPGRIGPAATSTCTITLSNPAPAGGTPVALSSNNALLTTPALVTVAPGSTSSAFTVTAASTIPSDQTATVTATMNGGITQTATLNLSAVIAVSSLACIPPSVASNTTSTCTITLTSSAPVDGISVALASNNALLTVPATAAVPAGSTSVTFLAVIGAITGNQSATVTATLNGHTQSTTLSMVAPAVVSSLACIPAVLGPGSSGPCTITLTLAAPSGGSAVALASDNPLVSTPASITVGAGALSASFTITAGAVAAGQTATLTASLNGTSVTSPLTLVVPGPVSGASAAFAFNEGAGSTIADSSGNGISGLVQGAAWTPGGRYGNALSFDGGASFVDLGSPAGLQSTGSMTWSAWIYAGGDISDDGMIASRSDGSSGWQLKTTDDTGTRTFGMAVSTAAASLTQRYSTTKIALNTWYHVAGIYNATAQTLDIYVNGVLDDGVLVGSVGGSQVPANTNATIGKRVGGFFFKGVIDNLRIYNRALSASEVQSDMYTPVPMVVSSLQCSPGTIVSAASASCTVRLSETSAAGTAVAISSNNALLTAPASVTVAAGTAAVAFPATAGSIPANQTATLTATLNSVSQSAVLNLAAPAVLSTLNCLPGAVGPGIGSACTVTLSTAAPAGGISVALASNNPLLTVPASVLVPAGAVTAAFTATAGIVDTDQAAAVTASLNGGTLSAPVNLLAGATVSSVNCTVTGLVSGASTACTVNLTRPAPASGVTLALASNNPLLTVPASVAVPANSASAPFTVTAGAIPSDQSATVTAALAAITQSTTVNLLAPLSVKSLSCTPAVLAAGTPSSCTLTVSRSAPAEGAAIVLSSSNPLLTAPVSATVAPGSTTATFTATAGDVAGNQAATLTATLNGIPTPASFSLVVPGALPGAVAAYGFNEGAGALTADSSGNGNTGTSQGAAAWSTSGRFGNALLFDGTSAFVDLGKPASLQNTGSTTWSAWVYATGVPPDDGTIASRSDGSPGWQFKTSNDTGSRTFGIGVSPDGVSLTQRYSKTVLSLNNWYHVAAVYNAAAQTLNIFVNGLPDDGTLVGSVGAAQFLPNIATTIGSRADGFFFKGMIDNLRIYNRALSPAEVQTDMYTPVPVAVTVTSVKCLPNGLASNAAGTCTVTLNQPAPAGGSQVAIASSHPLLTAATSVVVPAGATSATFTATAGVISANDTAVLTVTLNGSAQSASVSLLAPVMVSLLNCNLPSLGSGGVSVCTITLTRSQTAWTIVSLARNSTSLTVPASVLIAAGATTGNFNAVAGAIATDQTVTITATLNGSSQSTTLGLVSPPALSLLSCNPTSLGPGAASACSVTLNKAAPAGGATVALSSNNALLTAPASVAVPAGLTSMAFNAIAAGAIPSDQSAALTATLNGASQNVPFSLVSPLVLSSLLCTPNNLGNGEAGTCTATLSRPAPEGGATVALSSNNALLAAPASIVVPAGSLSAAFAVTASASLPNDQAATVTGVLNSTSRSASVSLSTPVQLISLNCTTTSLGPGAASSCTVNLSKAAPAGGTTVAVSSNNALLTAPPSVVVPAGSTSMAFNATAAASLPSDQSAALTATLNSTSQSVPVSLVTPVLLASLGCNPTNLTPGMASACTVTLTKAAPAGGTAVAVSSNNALLPAPPAITVPAGSTSAVLNLTASAAIASDQSAVVTATLNSSSRTATFNLESPAVLSSLACLPSSLTPGNTSTCTVTMSQAAPAGGSPVALSSNNPLLPTPPSVVIPGGSTSTTFTATAPASIPNDQTVALTAVYDNSSQSATVQLVTPVLLTALNCTPTGVLSGAATTCTLSLSKPAPASTAVALSSGSSLLTVPASVTAAAGNSSVSFIATAGSLATDTPALVTATLAAASVSTTVTLWSTPALSSMTCTPTALPVGTSSTCTINLSKAAGNILVALSTSNPTALAVPASATVAQGATSTTFLASSRALASGWIIVTASFNSVNKSTLFTISAAPSSDSSSSALHPSAISCSPKSLAAGAHGICRVELEGVSDSSVAELALSSSDGALRLPPLAVSRPGQSTLEFELDSADSAGPLSAVISAQLGVDTVQDTVAVHASRHRLLQVHERQFAKYGSEIRFQVSRSDPSATLSAALLPPGASFDAEAGVFAWTPAASQTGSFELAFTAVTADGQSDTAQVLVLVDSGSPVATRLLNAATRSTGAVCSSGAIASIEGRWLFDGAPLADPSGASTTLAGTSIVINGSFAPLLYASSTRLDFLCPDASEGTPLELFVLTPNGATATLRSSARAAAPGIFSLDGSGSGQGRISHAGGASLVSLRNPRFPGQPAIAGDRIVIYASGLASADMVSVRLGTRELTPDLVEAIPGYAGLFRITLTVPQDAHSGNSVGLSLLVHSASGQVVESNLVSLAIESLRR